MFPSLDRYLMREIAGPLFLGFFAYTFILLVQFLFRSAEMIIRRGVPASQIGELLVLTLPNIIVLTIPMSFLFAVLVAIGRMSSDSEMVALRSSGVNLWRLLRPIVAIGTLLMIVNGFLMLDTLPKGNAELQDLRLRILTSSASRQVEPRVFYEEWRGLMIYVFEAIPGDDEWTGVFVAKVLPGSGNEISVAQRGEMRADPTNPDRLILKLVEGVEHKVNLRDAEQYETRRYEEVNQVLEDPLATAANLKRRSSRGLRELTVPELRARLKDPSLPDELRNLANVEIHKKFALPAACLIYGLLALPLGIQKARGGRGTGFGLSLAVIILHYVMMSNGEEAARYGRMPAWLSMWLPNLLLGTLGLILLLRKNEDQPLLPGPIDYWLRSSVVPRVHKLVRMFRRRKKTATHRVGGAPPRARSGAVPGGLVLRIPKILVRFPNLMDRYIGRLFASVFALVLLSGLTLFSISDLTEKIDEILDNEIPLTTVLDYYKYASVQIGFDVAPIAILVTILVIFGVLSRTNEIIAAKSLGISVYRLAVPALGTALLVSLLGGWLQERVLPAANQRAAQLNDEIRGRELVHSYRRGDRNWLFGQDRYIYNYLNYDTEAKQLHRLQIFEFDSDHRLISRLYAEKARYVGDGWVFENVWTRSFNGLTQTGYQPVLKNAIGQFPETPEFFESEIRTPDALSYRALKSYIGELEASGQAVPELWTQLHYKVSYPATFLVMGFVALPFAFRMGRKGALYGIGLGLVLGMVFLATVAFCSTLGETGALPPRLAVWAPSLAFMLLSLYTFLGVET
ncbi:MAG: YjgP/YjgQ family permease [bacterium]|nr:YjgP/YjgQ family permease [bacterium]